MIKANELRIGNIIWESNSFTPAPEDFNEIIVASINDIDKVVRDEQENGYSFDMLYGIPLTSEWLGKMVFEAVRPTMMPGYVLYRSESWDKRHRFRWDAVEGLTIETVGSGWVWPQRHIQQVHQLQNLYLALTGEELTIKK